MDGFTVTYNVKGNKRLRLKSILEINCAHAQQCTANVNPVNGSVSVVAFFSTGPVSKHAIKSPHEERRHAADGQKHDDPTGGGHTASFVGGALGTARPTGHRLPATFVKTPKSTRDSKIKPTLSCATKLDCGPSSSEM